MLAIYQQREIEIWERELKKKRKKKVSLKIENTNLEGRNP